MLQAEKGSGGNGGQDQRLGVFHKFVKFKKKNLRTSQRLKENPVCEWQSYLWGKWNLRPNNGEVTTKWGSHTKEGKHRNLGTPDAWFECA